VLLQGWRYALAGNPLQQLANGEIEIRNVNGELKLEGLTD
jgi:hypothetical protein